MCYIVVSRYTKFTELCVEPPVIAAFHLITAQYSMCTVALYIAVALTAQ
jgi:hypothetical protein